jgi:hypothetical protein
MVLSEQFIKVETDVSLKLSSLNVQPSRMKASSALFSSYFVSQSFDFMGENFGPDPPDIALLPDLEYDNFA